jgi:glutathione peroxidase-family protein
MKRFHDLEMSSIGGEPVEFSSYRDQVSLIVNVASE